jgi:hypothetical protein
MVCVWFSCWGGCFVFGYKGFVNRGDFIGRKLPDGLDSVVAKEGRFVDVEAFDAFFAYANLSNEEFRGSLLNWLAQQDESFHQYAHQVPKCTTQRRPYTYGQHIS